MAGILEFGETARRWERAKREVYPGRPVKANGKELLEGLCRADLEMVALDYFRCLGHDNHRRFSKLYAWEEKKSKTSWGARTVDYEKIAAAAVEAMKAADLNRLLVVCALVSDLYCPGYNPRQPLEKNTNLARTAARYKIDSAKIVTDVRAEVSKPKSKVKDHNKAVKTVTTLTAQPSKDLAHKGTK